MPAFVALLRAVNVGGTGKLAMADLRGICERQGYKNVRTYIASGIELLDVAFAEAFGVSSRLTATRCDPRVTAASSTASPSRRLRTTPT